MPGSPAGAVFGSAGGVATGAESLGVGVIWGAGCEVMYERAGGSPGADGPFNPVAALRVGKALAGRGILRHAAGHDHAAILQLLQLGPGLHLDALEEALVEHLALRIGAGIEVSAQRRALQDVHVALRVEFHDGIDGGDQFAEPDVGVDQVFARRLDAQVEVGPVRRGREAE